MKRNYKNLKQNKIINKINNKFNKIKKKKK